MPPSPPARLIGRGRPPNDPLGAWRGALGAIRGRSLAPRPPVHPDGCRLGRFGHLRGWGDERPGNARGAAPRGTPGPGAAPRAASVVESLARALSATPGGGPGWLVRVDGAGGAASRWRVSSRSGAAPSTGGGPGTAITPGPGRGRPGSRLTAARGRRPSAWSTARGSPPAGAATSSSRTCDGSRRRWPPGSTSRASSRSEPGHPTRCLDKPPVFTERYVRGGIPWPGGGPGQTDPESRPTADRSRLPEALGRSSDGAGALRTPPPFS